MSTGLNIPLVTYKGTGPVVTDLLGAHIPLGIIDIPSAEAALASGKVRALAISSARRFEGLPDVPTFQEAGLKDFEAIGFLGVVAPAGVPPEALATLNRAFATVLKDPGGPGAVQVVRQRAADDRPARSSAISSPARSRNGPPLSKRPICGRNDMIRAASQTDRMTNHAQAPSHRDCDQ